MTKKKVTVGKVVQYTILILMFILLVGPFVWEISLAFKGRADNVYAVPPYLIPKSPTWENFKQVFRQVPIMHYVVNTLAINPNRLKDTFKRDPRLMTCRFHRVPLLIVIFFACFQKYFFQGLDQGEVKE